MACKLLLTKHLLHDTIKSWVLLPTAGMCELSHAFLVPPS